MADLVKDGVTADHLLVDVLNEPDNYGIRWEAGNSKPGGSPASNCFCTCEVEWCKHALGIMENSCLFHCKLVEHNYLPLRDSPEHPRRHLDAGIYPVAK